MSEEEAVGAGDGVSVPVGVTMMDGEGTNAQALRELEDARTTLGKMVALLAKGHLRGGDAEVEIRRVKDRLLEAVPKDSPAFPPIDKISRSILVIYSHRDDGYVSDGRKVTAWYAAIDEAIKAIRPDVLGDGGDRDEYYFSPGQRYDALRTVLTIMRRATKKVLLIDPHMGDTVLDLARALTPTVRVELLTTHDKPHFPRLYHALVGQRGEVEARRGTGFHDRFVVVDERDVWTVGSSFNSLGDKATSIHRLRDTNEIEKQLRDAAGWWSGANLVPPPS